MNLVATFSSTRSKKKKPNILKTFSSELEVDSCRIHDGGRCDYPSYMVSTLIPGFVPPAWSQDLRNTIQYSRG